MTDQQHKQDPFIKQQCTSIFRERRPMRLPSELNTITAFAIALFCFFPASGAADDPKSQPFPQPPGKKGLQVQMVDDAIALGIHHAGININLTALFQTVADDNTVRFAHGGREWLINGAYAASLDNQIRPLSEKGIVVYVILLAYPSGEAARDAVMLHPSASGEFTIAGFNTASDDGLRSYRALIAFLAERYSGLHAEHGRVWGWIVGNEVNSQKIWYNLGSMSMNEAAAEYEKAVRATHDSVREHSGHGRCYLSFDHFWAARMPGVSEQESYPTREFLMEFARISRERGDFEWHIAHHPYPDDLGNPRTWLDKLATPTDDSPHITFKNLEVLCEYLQKPELRWKDQPRRIILSEQGLHCLQTEEGETLQAAGFAYVWEKVSRQPSIDALIWHRHVDHAHEGGLRLGLWANTPGTISQPERQRLIYQLFRKADTAEWPAATAFALPLVGLDNWNSLNPPTSSSSVQ
jgi:hypothetical protein